MGEVWDLLLDFGLERVGGEVWGLLFLGLGRGVDLVDAGFRRRVVEGSFLAFCLEAAADLEVLLGAVHSHFQASVVQVR